MTLRRCREHGSIVDEKGLLCDTARVLNRVSAERARQKKLHGVNLENHSGTGPEVAWAAPIEGWADARAVKLEELFREAYNAKSHVTWLDILLEEFTEVARESDPQWLAEELIQLAAVAVSWVEKLQDPESVINQPAHGRE